MISLQEYVTSHFPMVEPSNVTEKATVYIFPGRDAETERTKLVVLERTVFVVNEQFIQGTNKHSGAAWKRWNAVSTTYYSLKKERDGVPLLRIYNTARLKNKGKVIRNATPTQIQRLIIGMNPNQSYNSVVMNTIIMVALLHRYALITETSLPETIPAKKKTVLELAYPVVKFFPEVDAEKTANLIQTNSKIWLGTVDIKNYIQRNFGVKAVRKDMVKALTTLKDPECLQLLTLFKGTVPVDWFIMLLRNQDQYTLTKSTKSNNRYHYGPFTPEDKRIVKAFFKLLTIHQQKKLFRSTEKLEAYHLRDTLTLMDKIGIDVLKEELSTINMSTWHELHNSLSALQRKLAHKPKAVPQQEVMEKLDGCELKVEDAVYKIKSPKMTDELIDWGYQLNNCIASYASQVLSKRTTVFAVYSDSGKLVANLEYNRGRVVQFVEKHNQPVKKEMYSAFEQLLKDQEISYQVDQPLRDYYNRPAAQGNGIF